MPRLNEKHRRFIAEYLRDLNATEAAIRAGYSPRTAKQQGSRLLTHADIQAGIQAGQAKHLEKVDITAEQVLAELARIAFVDPRKFFDANGVLLPVSQVDDATAAAISEFVILKENITSGDGKSDLALRVKWADKLRALELLGKRFALFKERIEITGANELVERLTRARQRVKNA